RRSLHARGRWRRHPRGAGAQFVVRRADPRGSGDERVRARWNRASCRRQRVRRRPLVPTGGRSRGGAGRARGLAGGILGRRAQPRPFIEAADVDRARSHGDSVHRIDLVMVIRFLRALLLVSATMLIVGLIMYVAAQAGWIASDRTAVVLI